MKLLLQTSLGLAFLLVACTSSKTVTTTTHTKSGPTPIGTLSYKVFVTGNFEHLDASYINGQHHPVLQQDISQNPVEYTIGKINSDFVSAISCTGYNGQDSTTMIKLQIIVNGVVAETDSITGLNPSISISYAPEISYKSPSSPSKTR